MANNTPPKLDRNKPEITRSNDIRLTAKAYAEQHGVSGRDVVDVVSRYGIEAHRDDSGLVTYDLDDLNHFMTQSLDDMRRRQRETELEFFRRLLPEIKATIAESVREVCKQELTLAVAIRDTKESMLVELLGAQRAQVREIRGTIAFLTRLVAQVNLATVAGAFSSLPTSGVNGFSESLGVDVPLPGGIGFPSISENTRTNPKNRSSNADSHLKDSSNSTQKAKRSAPASAARYPSPLTDQGTIYRDDNGGQNSPLFRLMLPQLATLDQPYASPIVQNLLLIEEILQMNEMDLARMDLSEKSAIDDILAPWNEVIADLPRFTTFFGSFSMLQAWIAEKGQEMPLLISFLALNRQVPGCIAASDFVDMCGVVSS